MQADRVRQLLDAYGADPGRWPEKQRDAMQAALARDPELEAVRREAAELDRLLDGYAVGGLDLTGRILAAIPETRLERLLGWLLPAEPTLWWRPAMAAALPLVLGVAIGVSDIPLTGATYDWSAQEQALLGGATPESWYE